MSGGAHADTFEFGTMGWGQRVGNDVITDFQVGVDVLQFGGVHVHSLADLTFSKVVNDTVFNYGTYNGSITLVGVGFEQLMSHQAHDFLFV